MNVKETSQGLARADEKREMQAKKPSEPMKTIVECGKGVKLTIWQKANADSPGVEVTSQNIETLVGVRTILEARVEAASEVATMSWRVGGQVVRNYWASKESGSVTLLKEADLSSRIIRFYWVRASLEAEIAVTVLLRDRSKHSANVHFLVKGPVGTILAEWRNSQSASKAASTAPEIGYPPYPYGDFGTISADQIMKPSFAWPVVGADNEYDLVARRFRSKTGEVLFPDTVYELHLGVPVANAEGIYLEGRIPPGVNGKLAFVQLVKSERRRRQINGPEQIWQADGLDDEFPYSGPFDSEKKATFEDSPSQPLSHNVDWLKVDDRFETWLMFKPEGVATIWVPLVKTNWAWSAKAIRRRAYESYQHGEDWYQDFEKNYDKEAKKGVKNGLDRPFDRPLCDLLPPNPWECVDPSLSPPLSCFDPFTEGNGFPEWKTLAQNTEWRSV